MEMDIFSIGVTTLKDYFMDHFMSKLRRLFFSYSSNRDAWGFVLQFVISWSLLNVLRNWLLYMVWLGIAWGIVHTYAFKVYLILLPEIDKWISLDALLIWCWQQMFGQAETKQDRFNSQSERSPQVSIEIHNLES